MIWQQPIKLNGILIGYKLVFWRSDDEQTRIEIDNLTNTTNSYLVESMSKSYDYQTLIFYTPDLADIDFFNHLDLEKTTPYTFILCAKTRIGCGEPSINRLLTMEKRGIREYKNLFFI